MIHNCAHKLRIPPDAPAEEVRNAFVKLARRYPPEHFPRRFVEIKECADLMSLEDDAVKRVAGYKTVENIVDVFSVLFHDAIQEPADDNTMVELDLPAFFGLLQEKQLKQDLLDCLQNIPLGESHYRR